ncbi:L-serine ammonia-lyase, iron-sulfur-dependent, subunit alpha [Tissierella pigra]|uniref:L-cysteine desulfidase family protein n=1 Tax=Tissierella pigra TaxID=2607614 RepID=UPI001C115504|nr:L-serine ammonia-lyase, iron-sulfur-dependent, subunit alpha [Tissierella pigra]MBU5427646.1 L-serine ammonia-lyase, iron-sulfur-dependent, subunit alpha [Tissierella pigra]
MINNNLLIEILKDQVKPALGCTEPGAVAYAVARAKEILDSNVENLIIGVNSNILKNGLGVGIPGTNERGIIFAAALSLVIGKSEYGLEVLKDVKKESIKEALDIVNSKIITLELNKEAEGLYISVEAFSKNNTSKVIIKNSHTNIVFESKNDEVLLNKDNLNKEQSISSTSSNYEIKYEIQNFNIKKLIDFSINGNIEDLSFIQDGIDMNLCLAKIGISEDLGMGLGKYLYDNVMDVYTKAKAYTSGASEARMSGYPLPVMSSAGSGNHGLVAIIPLSIIGKEKNISEEKIIRSITLSHLVTIYVKSYIGSLSPVCGCGVAAGVGCAAGLTFMGGGNHVQIQGSINNMIAGITGMICDGAKLGCSYKLSISVDAAIDASNMALKNIFIPIDNGILGETTEQTIKNLAHVSNTGMNNTDNIILDVMLNKC